MTDEHRMEQLSRAYVHAVAAVCGCTCARPDPDYGVDLTLRPVRWRAGEWVPASRWLDIQLKSTTTAVLTVDHVIYDLPMRAYNILRRATLRGEPAVANASTVRVRLPRVNRFTPEAISRIITGS